MRGRGCGGAGSEHGECWDWLDYCRRDAGATDGFSHSTRLADPDGISLRVGIRLSRVAQRVLDPA